MSEKRHWLVRDHDDASNYSVCIAELPPVPVGTCWMYQGNVGDGEWLAENPQPQSDGTVYGHKLEPGGGPVDVSEWFPEGGRHCTNCAHENEHCPEQCDDKPSGHYPGWKPRKQPFKPTLSADDIMEDLGYNAAGKARGEDEGGCEMRTFKVVAVEQPSVIEIQNGAEAKVIQTLDDILAKDERTALWIAGTKLSKETAQKMRSSLVELTVVPFGP
jgi:hypothetical protein